MRTNLFKSLLVAAMAIGAMGGVNAATGDVKTNVDIDFSNAISENKVNGTVGSLNITQNSKFPTEISNGILVLGNGIHNVIIPESERANDKDIVTTSFDLAFGKLIDKDFYFYFEDGDGNKIGNFELCAYWSRLTNDFGIEVGDVFLPKNVANWNKRATFTITYDYAKKSITTTVLNHDGNKTATHIVAMSSTKPIAKFCIGSNYVNQDRRCQFDNLKITTTEGNYSNKTISIKYTTEDGLDIPNENIPENTVFTYSEAANTEFTPTYPSTFSTDDYIYTYVSGGDAFTVTEDKTVTLVYKKGNREKVNIVLNCIDENGETLEQQTVATNYPIDKSFIYGINKYIIKDGNLYEANTLGQYNNYVASVNATATPIDIKYKKVNTTGTPIYFADFGDEPNTNTSSTEYMRASGGQTAASNSKVVLVPANVLAPGYYDFEIAHYKNRDPKFNVGDKEYGVCSRASNSGLMVTTEFKNVLVINGEEISVTPGGSSYTDNMDYVLVTRTGDATETVSVSEAGFATYATTNNVIVPEDENVKVMTVKVNAEGTAIELNKVEAGTVIPAKTGILVKAAKGNHDFAVTSDKGEALANNNLKAATADEASNGTTFFALTKIGEKVGFALVEKDVVIPAGKAYLEVTKSTAAKFFGLDGEATGINSVKTAKADGAYYTLEGVKTTKPVKGLYIHNGKKIVVK